MGGAEPSVGKVHIDLRLPAEPFIPLSSQLSLDYTFTCTFRVLEASSLVELIFSATMRFFDILTFAAAASAAVFERGETQTRWKV